MFSEGRGVVSKAHRLRGRRRGALRSRPRSRVCGAGRQRVRRGGARARRRAGAARTASCGRATWADSTPPGRARSGRRPWSWSRATARVDSYWAATTVSWVAAAAVACGEVVLQVTLPALLVQLYQLP